MIKKLNLKNSIKYSVFNTKALSSKQGSENTKAFLSQAQRNTLCGSDTMPPVCNLQSQKS
jgi:hypothetical protein